MRYLFFSILALLLSFPTFSQEDYAIAKAGFRVQGVYIFVACEPVYEYEYIATIKAKVTWTGLSSESFEKSIKKAKKKYKYFNGLIFHDSDLDKADLIKFKELGTSRVGFKIGDKVSFILSGKQHIGEVIELQSTKKKASIKYTDDEGLEQIKKIKYTDLTPYK